MLGNNGREFVVAVTILFSFSVDCWCFNSERILPVFRAMLPIASTPWEASLTEFSYHKINKAIHYVRSLQEGGYISQLRKMVQSKMD